MPGATVCLWQFRGKGHLPLVKVVATLTPPYFTTRTPYNLLHVTPHLSMSSGIKCLRSPNNINKSCLIRPSAYLALSLPRRVNTLFSCPVILFVPSPHPLVPVLTRPRLLVSPSPCLLVYSVFSSHRLLCLLVPSSFCLLIHLSPALLSFEVPLSCLLVLVLLSLSLCLFSPYFLWRLFKLFIIQSAFSRLSNFTIFSIYKLTRASNSWTNGNRKPVRAMFVVPSAAKLRACLRATRVNVG